VIVGAATAAFQRSVTADTAAESIPWTAAAALLPVTLAAGVVVGVRVARQRGPSEYEPAAVVGTWVIFAGAIGLGLAIRAVFGLSAEILGPPARVVSLYVVALVAGLAAARVAGRTRTPIPTEERGESFRLDASPAWSQGARIAATLVPAMTTISVGVTLWLAYEGLRVGFL
jgi:ribose/xylose/arabinose/galactoside ABC-type transport system permease subunit